MKKTIKAIASFLLVVPLCLSCSNKMENGGTISFEISSQSEIAEVTKSDVSSYTKLPSGDDFTITVLDAREREIYKGLVKNYPTEKTLLAGNYTVTAQYGDVNNEGFDLPCFKGSASFTVTGETHQDVKIITKLANCVIKVLCTDVFKQYYPEYTLSIKTGAGNVIAFKKDETRAAFVDAYKITLEGTLKNQAGKDVKFTGSEEYKLYPATCYTMKFDVSNVGTGSVTFTFDDNVNDLTGWIELNQ